MRAASPRSALGMALLLLCAAGGAAAGVGLAVREVVERPPTIPERLVVDVSSPTKYIGRPMMYATGVPLGAAKPGSVTLARIEETRRITVQMVSLPALWSVVGPSGAKIDEAFDFNISLAVGCACTRGYVRPAPGAADESGCPPNTMAPAVCTSNIEGRYKHVLAEYHFEPDLIGGKVTLLRHGWSGDSGRRVFLEAAVGAGDVMASYEYHIILQSNARSSGVEITGSPLRMDVWRHGVCTAEGGRNCILPFFSLNYLPSDDGAQYHTDDFIFTNCKHGCLVQEADTLGYPYRIVRCMDPDCTGEDYRTMLINRAQSTAAPETAAPSSGGGGRTAAPDTVQLSEQLSLSMRIVGGLGVGMMICAITFWVIVWLRRSSADDESDEGTDAAVVRWEGWYRNNPGEAQQELTATAGRVVGMYPCVKGQEVPDHFTCCVCLEQPGDAGQASAQASLESRPTADPSLPPSLRGRDPSDVADTDPFAQLPPAAAPAGETSAAPTAPYGNEDEDAPPAASTPAQTPPARTISEGPKRNPSWTILTCEHEIHSRCLRKWLMSRLRGRLPLTCPVCRAELNVGQDHPDAPPPTDAPAEAPATDATSVAMPSPTHAATATQPAGSPRPAGDGGMA